jgi:hypothetical protein
MIRLRVGVYDSFWEIPAEACRRAARKVYDLVKQERERLAEICNSLGDSLEYICRRRIRAVAESVLRRKFMNLDLSFLNAKLVLPVDYKRSNSGSSARAARAVLWR